MKYMIIRGAKDQGKSTTIDAVCKQLNPDTIEKLNATQRTLIPVDFSKPLHNECYVLELGGKIILVSAGATTEHGLRITLLIKIVVEIKGRVDFAIVAMRKYERKEGFDTPAELAALGEDMGTVYIYDLGEDYVNSGDWKKRVEGIVDVLRDNGLPIEKTAMAY